ncbi:MAG: class I SAM-dependent methyltransferase [Spirochaetaceae bacterium]|nr:class I SAM-dependent methyltransferase [Spirochaetaceae bacterium]
MTEWFDDDNFWLNFEEMMFDPDRLNRTSLDVAEMVTLCSLRKGMTVLDHCCGFGRHAIEFAKLGYKVSGVDLSKSYLAIAQAKSKKHDYNINWHEADVRNFYLDNSFDFIYNFFTSFGYIEEPAEELKVVQNVYRSLKPGGKFLIDIEGKETLAKNFIESQCFDGQDGSIMLVMAEILDNWSRVQNRWGYLKDGKYTETTFAHKLYSAVEMGQLLTKAGFSYVQFFGNLQGINYDNNAERMIVVAVKE